MLKYLEQQSELTLLEGIQELRKFEAERNNDMMETRNNEFIEKLEGHDVIHSLFGCKTDIKGEIKVHLWMVFGTNTKMSEIKSVLGSKDHKETLKEIGHKNLIKRWFFAVPIAIKIFWLSNKMKKKYDIRIFEKDLNKNLASLRKEYNINIL